MAPDDRSSVRGNMVDFDFNSQSGVLGVLAAIRASELSPADKNELRDVVFLYSNGGGDAAVRGMLEERLRAHNIVPLIPVAKAVEVEKSLPKTSAGFAIGRPAPTFTPGTPSLTDVVPFGMTTVPPVAVVMASLPVATPVIPTPVIDIISDPVRPIVVPAPAHVPVQRVVPQQPLKVVPITPVAVPAAMVSLPVPAAEPVVTSESVDVATTRLDRIREIKADVNARVGNPVNLVNIDNALGHEYMAALLGAMKLLSTASSQESGQAMVRLETAYELIKEILEVRDQSPVEVIAPHVPVTPTAPEIVSFFAEPRAVPPTPVYPVEPKFPSKPVSVTNASSLPVAEPWSDAEVITARPIAPVVPRVVHTELQKMERIQNAPVTTVMENTVVAPSISQNVMPLVTPLVSVAASAAPLRSIQELPTTDDVRKASIVGDPLYTKEVDDGLHQLLSEWSLFKKSGLFGTGPHGRQHPIFLKIAGIQLPLILAGRFEGATQEIKQSITDYMNGWRYEQGIVYEQNETFEQYLRRVIRHIIDLQNKRRGS